MVIDAPGGGKIDVTAELPAHMADSFGLLGFDPARGEPLVEAPQPVANAKPKARRLSSSTSGNRRGERWSRGKG